MATTHEWFHGTDGGTILKIMSDGSMKGGEKSHQIFFSERFEDAFVHGADTNLGASFAFKAQVTVVDGASVSRTSKPGNPLTVVVTTTLPLPAKLTELYVRLGRAGEFEVKAIRGAQAIQAYLNKAIQASKAQ